MSIQPDSPAVAAARAHVDAWSDHHWETARDSLAAGVTMTATTVDPAPPKVELTGADAYMQGLIDFGQAVVPGTAQVLTAWGDERRALLTLTARVAFGPGAPEMTLLGSRIYQFDEDGKIADEQVVFLVAPD